MDMAAVRKGRLVTVLTAGVLAVSGQPMGPEAKAAATPAVPLSECAQSDNGDPQLTAFSVAPAVVDVQRRPARVTFSARVADTGGPGPASGVARVIVDAADRMVELAWVDGDLWQRTQRLTPGQWGGSRTGSVRLEIFDRAGNRAIVKPDGVQAAGGPPTLTVRSPVDAVGPRLRSFWLSLTSVDTRRRTRSIQVRARVTDALSGVRNVYVQGLARRGMVETWLSRTSGGARDGVWTGTLVVPRWIGTGPLDVTVKATDRAGHRRPVRPRRLKSLGWPSRIDVTSRSDRTRLEISDVVVSPSAVDARTSDVAVRVSVRAKDEGAPVTGGYLTLEPSGVPVFRRTSALATLTGGSPRDGVWSTELVLPRCQAVTATWNLRIQMHGMGRNSRTVARAASVPVSAMDTVMPVVSPYFARQPADRPLTIAFSEPVTGVSAASAQVSEYRSGSPVPGDWACQDLAGAPTPCDGTAVRSAALATTQQLQPGFLYSVRINPPGNLDLRDLAGNPALPRQSVLITAVPSTG